MATVTSHYARSALTGARRHGLDITKLLGQSGLSQRLIEAKHSRIHTEQMAALVREVWEGLNDEFMGFTKHPCKPGTLALALELIQHNSSVDTALLKSIEFYNIVTDAIKMELRFNGDLREFVVTMLNPELDPEHFFQEFWLVIWHRLSSWLCGQQIKLQAVHFNYPEPAHSDEFQYQFNCPCVYDALETKFSFSGHYGSQPLIRKPLELQSFLQGFPLQLMTIPGSDRSLSEQIKKGLQEAADLSVQAHGTIDFPKIEKVAASKAISEQSLRRRLRQEGASFKKLKDTVRCDIAIEKLAVAGQSVNEVSELLGFTEPRSFTRAFKHWTGLAPSAYQHRKHTL